MFLHGASARAFLVRSVHRFHVLLRCAVRVRPSRLRQRCSEGVSPGKITRRKANGKNRETKKEPLIREQAPALREWVIRVHRRSPTFRSAKEQENLLRFQSARLAGPDLPRENSYLVWERSRLVRRFRIQPIV